MRSRHKYLDFTIPDSLWKKQQPFVAVELDGNKNAKALQRWNPGRYKATWRMRLKNSHTKEQKSYPLTETLYRDGWIIAVFNMHEAISAIMGIIPTVLATSLVANIVSQIGGKKEDET